MDIGPDEASTVPVEGGTATDEPLVLMRRTPRYGRFIGTGVALGLLIAVVLTWAIPGDDGGWRWFTFGYLAVICGLVLAVLAGMLAVVTDRRRVAP